MLIVHVLEAILCVWLGQRDRLNHTLQPSAHGKLELVQVQERGTCTCYYLLLLLHMRLVHMLQITEGGSLFHVHVITISVSRRRNDTYQKQEHHHHYMLHLLCQELNSVILSPLLNLKTKGNDVCYSCRL